MLTVFAQAFDWMGGLSPTEFWPALGQIMLINLILSGDNAVVIALACRALPKSQRMWGIVLGALVAIILRVIFTVGVTSLLQWPWLQAIGSLLLFWIAIKLLVEDGEEKDIKESSSVWGAVRTVAIADLVMSLDNVLAIAAAANNNWSLIIIGLTTSIPIIVFGATLVMWLLNKLPVLVWAGAGLLGWIAGKLLVADKVVAPFAKAYVKQWGLPAEVHYKLGSLPLPALGKVPIEFGGETHEVIAGIVGVLFVIVMGAILRGRHAKGETEVAH